MEGGRSGERMSSCAWSIIKYVNCMPMPLCRLCRYAAQAGRVFVFMQEQPMNDSIDLASPLTRDSYDRPGNALSSFLDRKFSGGRFDEAWMCEKLQNSIGASFDRYCQARGAQGGVS